MKTWLILIFIFLSAFAEAQSSGIPGSRCLDCTVVRCASPESLGCPDRFVIDPCRCCPRCLPRGPPRLF